MHSLPEKFFASGRNSIKVFGTRLIDMFAYVDNPDELNEQYDCAEWASGVADKIDDTTVTLQRSEHKFFWGIGSSWTIRIC